MQALVFHAVSHPFERVHHEEATFRLAVVRRCADQQLGSLAAVKRELEHVFHEENEGDHPGRRSLSMGDLVVLGESAWFCAPVGWQQTSLRQECVVD